MVGTVVAAVSCLFAAIAHAQPIDMLIASALLSVGIGLAYSALGNLIVQAVPAPPTRLANGINTVTRTARSGPGRR